MDILEEIKAKLITNETLDKEIGKAFGNIYSAQECGQHGALIP